MTTATYAISGMTCGHCVAAVSDELVRLAGVEKVQIDLTVGGISSATVTSAAPLAAAQVREAVDEAGYVLEDSFS